MIIEAAWKNFERFVYPATEDYSTQQVREARRAFYSGFVEGALTTRTDAEQQLIGQEFAEFLDQMDKGVA